MKKLSFIFAITILLASCSKEAVEQEIHSQTVVYNGKTYELEFIKNIKTGEIIHSEKNNEYNMLTDKFDESVLAVFGEKAIFFETREDYFDFIEPKIDLKSDCTGSGTAVSFFYNGIDYNDLLLLRFPDETSNFTHYRQYWGVGAFSLDLASVIGTATNVPGFRVPYVGNSFNDKISSVKTNVSPATITTSWGTFPNTMQTDFTTVMFQHSNYGGNALALHTSACSPDGSGYQNLSWLKMTLFKNWNDDISSYTGYFLKLNWVN